MDPVDLNLWLVVLGTVLLPVTAVLLTAVLTSRRIHRKVNYMLDALEDGETAFRYREDRFLWRGLHRTMNRLRSIFDAEIRKISEQDRYYGKMLDRIPTGILVTDLSERSSGTVIYTNAAALSLLGLPALGHIRQLATVDPELKEAFESVSENREVRTSVFNERSRITLSLTAVHASLDGKEVKIVTFNDITGNIAQSEELSWNRLIRVLTHEIMNTVTPIASLSETLSEDLRQAASSDAASLDVKDLQKGLETIASSSKGLIRFVDTYRSLTRVSAPVKRPFYLRELISRVRQLTAEQLEASGVSFTYTEKSEDILLYADDGQIAQILVNLIRNAVQAGADRIAAEAEINASEQVILSVSNNGKPVSPASRDEIFVPFYTTKKEGSGIGLSLSRQIMRLHNGTLDLVRSDERITTFCLSFR